MREHIIEDWTTGQVTDIEAKSIPENAASASLNWLTLGDRIELSGGYSIVGTEDASAGRVTGLKVCQKADGTLFPVKTYGQKVEYYTTDWNEAGTNVLGADADGEDVAIAPYISLAGSQVWLCSQNSGPFKMMIANPDDLEDHYDEAKNFRGFIKEEGGAIYLWGRDGAENVLYRSYLDTQDDQVYTDVANEVLGAAGSLTYTGTLAQVTGVRTCFAVAIDDSGTQVVEDDGNGNFTGDGTGTINYTTGAYSVTFNAPAGGQVEADYSYEDSTAKGLADFRYADPRVATEGVFLVQPTGGPLRSTLFYQTDGYSLHDDAVWLVTISDSDDSATNRVFRSNIGIQDWRGAVADGDGIYFVDTSDPSEPRLKLITLEGGSDKVRPKTVNDNVDLSGYDFTYPVAYRWGDYILWACRSDGSAFNDRLFAYNKIYNSVDELAYRVSVMEDYDGALWCGDSLSNNVFQAFTGFAANNAIIENHWIGKLSQLQIQELKKFKRMTVNGGIGPDQIIRVSLAYDEGDFSEIGTIRGDGSYVNVGQLYAVGGPQVGAAEVGGGGAGIEAYEYTREFRVRSPKFERVRVKYEALDVGYASVSRQGVYDIKTYGQKELRRFRQTS